MTLEQAVFVKTYRIDKNFSYTSIAIVFSTKYDDAENPDYEYGRVLCNQARTIYIKENLNWNELNEK